MSALQWIREFSAKTGKSGALPSLLLTLEQDLDLPCSSSVFLALTSSWQTLSLENEPASVGSHITDYDAALNWAEIAVDFVWEQLNMGHWKDVGITLRETFAVASLFKGLCLVHVGKQLEALNAVDRGILLGAPILENSLHSFARALTADSHCGTSAEDTSKSLEQIHSTSPDIHINRHGTELLTAKPPPCKKKIAFRNYRQFQSLAPQETNLLNAPSCNIHTDPDSETLTSSKRRKKSSTHSAATFCGSPNDVNQDDQIQTAIPPCIRDSRNVNGSLKIPQIYCPTLETFHQSFMSSETPVVLTGVLDVWPAYAARKWSLEYLKRVAGPRTIPVELGSRYTDDDWSQKLMTLTEFIDDYVLPSVSSEVSNTMILM